MKQARIATIPLQEWHEAQDELKELRLLVKKEYVYLKHGWTEVTYHDSPPWQTTEEKEKGELLTVGQFLTRVQDEAKLKADKESRRQLQDASYIIKDQEGIIEELGKVPAWVRRLFK